MVGVGVDVLGVGLADELELDVLVHPLTTSDMASPMEPTIAATARVLIRNIVHPA